MIVVARTNPQTWNRYPYVGNDPMRNFDPSGLFYLLANMGDQMGSLSDEAPYWDDFGADPFNLGIGGNGGKAPLSDKDQKKYNKLKAIALKDMLNLDCVAFCVSHGIDPAQLASTLQNQQAYNGSISTLTQGQAQIGIANASGNIDLNESVADAFHGDSTVTAAGSLNGTDVYFQAGGFLSGLFGNSNISEGTIEHEALHNMTGLGDTGLQIMLGVKVNADCTTDITKALEDHHCTH